MVTIDGRLEVDLVGAAAALGMSVEAHAHAGHRRRRRGTARTATTARRRAMPSADQRVHRRGAVAQVRPRGAVERPRAPEHDRRGERAAPATASCRTAAPGSSRAAAPAATSSARDDQPACAAARLVGSSASSASPASSAGSARLVAGGLDGARRAARARPRRVEVDRGLLGRVVDRRGDAVELVELALDRGSRTRRRSCR